MVTPLQSSIGQFIDLPDLFDRGGRVGKLTVLLTALSVNFWKAACIRMWSSGVMSWAVMKSPHLGGDFIDSLDRAVLGDFLHELRRE